MILGALLLDSSSLFPKPIMANNVLAIGANLFGINYPRICVDVIIIIIIIMNSCLIAQAQCLTNWGDSMNLHKTKLDRLVPSFFDSKL